MLPQKSWKLEAIGRLGLSIVACMLGGEAVARAVQAASKASAHDWKFILSSLGALSAFGATVASLRKPWTFERALPRMIISLFFFQIGMVLAMLEEKLAGRAPPGLAISSMIISFVAFQGAALALTHRFLKEHAVRWRDAFGFLEKWEIAVLWGFIAGTLFYLVGRQLQEISAKVMTHLPFPVKPQEQQAIQTLRLASSWLDRIVLGVGTVMLAPIAEEILFRGILYTAIKRAGFPNLAMWATSLLFATIHFNLAIFLPLLVLAIVLSYLYEYTGNLLAPIAAHATFNAINFITLYVYQTAR
jgi:membrane protease YdiL (CAAX protease family)